MELQESAGQHEGLAAGRVSLAAPLTVSMNVESLV